MPTDYSDTSNKRIANTMDSIDDDENIKRTEKTKKKKGKKMREGCEIQLFFFKILIKF